MAIDYNAISAGSDIGSNIGGFAGNLAVMAGAGGTGGEAEYQNAVAAWKALKQVNFDVTKIPPAQQQVVATYFPEVWQEWTPQSAATIAGSPEARGQQVQALGQLQGMASGTTPLEDRVNATQLADQAGQARKQSELSVLSEMARRGQVGTGDELNARLSGAGRAADAANTFGTQMAAANMNRRLGAAQSASGAAGALRGQDVGEQQSNAQMINAFNELLANIHNQARSSRANAQSAANQYNTENQQKVYGEQNPLLAYQGKQYNQQYGNQMAQQSFSNQLSTTQGLANAMLKLGSSLDAEKAAREKNIMGASSTGGGILGALGGLF